MVSMVGKYAVTSGNTTEITSDGVGSVNATLASDAADVVMEVDDANGNALRHQSFGAFAAGVQSLTWDGLSDGQAVQPVGTYQVKVSAVDKNGQPVTVSQQSTRQITGVSFDSGTAQLMLGNTPVSLSDVISIQQSNSSQPNSQ
jgi:flagellar basal-body rod modification protein FlgD